MFSFPVFNDKIVIQHPVYDPLHPDGRCRCGLVEYTFQGFVVHHHLKWYPIQEQVKLFTTKITARASSSIWLYLFSVSARLQLAYCTTCHACSPGFLCVSGCQSHRTPAHVELVFRLGIEIDFSSSNASVCSCIHSNVPFSNSPSLQTAF